MSSILGTALSGLAAFQRSLETTSHNISNVNTDGYSRQRTELVTNPALWSGSGFVGTGVNVANIARHYDHFINKQLQSSTSAFGEADQYYKMAAQIDNIIADNDTSMAPALKTFFSAVNGMANDPKSIPARQVLLSEVGLVTQHFNGIGNRFADLRSQVNENLESSVAEINAVARELAELNVRIASDVGLASGRQMPNDLLDQRDALVNKIAKKVDVAVVEQGGGLVNIFIGQGQALVQGDRAGTLGVTGSPTDPLRKLITLDAHDISKQLSGGEVSGYLRFRDEVLDPGQQQLGLLAAGLGVEFNYLHKLGFDLNGSAGTAVFGFGTPEIPVNAAPTNSAAVVTATYKTTANPALLLEASDYQLDITGVSPAAYTLTRLSDNTVVPLTSVGFDLNLTSPSLAVGDTFLIRPTFNAAQTIKPLLTDPKTLAAATASAAVPGDNRNALALAQLESQSVMFNGKNTFSQTYGQMVSSVGTLTNSAKVSQAAQEVVLKQATAARENVSGVNLDEEAANLIKFQNSYQAAAKAVSVANSLFDTLIGAVR